MIVYLMAVNYECKILNPVILVPGDGGSQIEAKLNKTTANPFCYRHTEGYYNLWVNQEELFPHTITCFTDNMRLVYDKQKHVTRNSPGVETRIPGWGETQTVEWLDPEHVDDILSDGWKSTSYFSSIVNALVEWGYERNVSVRAAPYDFRKAANEFDDFYKSFKALVEETYALNNNTKVVLVGHSMGNPTTLYFLNHQLQSWKDKFIHSFITLAGVWGGSVKPLILLATGDNMGIPWLWPSQVRHQQRSMPSTAWLMPSDKFWGKDEILVEQPGRNYTVNDYEQFFIDMNFTDGWYMRQDTANLVKSLTPPGVEVHCLHGYAVPTPAKLVYTGHMWPDIYPNVTMDGGDGTVNIRSLQGCLLWQGKQQQKIYHHQIKGVGHIEILKHKDIIAYLEKILTRGLMLFWNECALQYWLISELLNIAQKYQANQPGHN
ncbi:LYPLA3 [Mytilus edulis]|uniref:LYPLA3 n=1 Tax=Mytilus edulis TaxID=6550 RepID=A0A8S3R2E5_MYTED|nr:LYPLA3 [Mytilus edulis]